MWYGPMRNESDLDECVSFQEGLEKSSPGLFEGSRHLWDFKPGGDALMFS